MAIFSEYNKDHFRNSLKKLGKVMCKRGIVTGAATLCLRPVKKHNVIEMTIVVHTINGVIRTKILHVFEMITSD